MQFVYTVSSFLHIMIRHNVDFCKNEPRFMPFIIFSFELYSITDDENELETIFISFMKNKSRGSKPLNILQINVR